MSQYDEGLIRVMDARIAAAGLRRDAFGVVEARDTTGPGAMVTMDGSTVAVPVKVFGHVHCIEDDRVALTLIEGTWCVIGTFGRRTLAEASSRVVGPGVAGTTTSGSYVDMPVPPQVVSFIKRYDATAVRVQIATTLWSSVADTDVRIGMRVAGRAGTATEASFTAVDVDVGRLQLDTAFVRGTVVGMNRLLIPAGEYTMTARWRRSAGTGELRHDSADQTNMEIDEVFRTAAN